jgi:hypothetical protein
LGLSGEKLAMGSRLQSNGITPAEKVGTLIPSGIFHSFQTKMTLTEADVFSITPTRLD